ncbi:MAG TPA: hypothetical protein PKC62_08265 [Ferruginibacter sp.]|jgi:hypothetical protein|nr:hypothetical protein [Bacteroidota bacterium]MBS1926016.1 hypothetical protein [Bacteroidota bacterium]HMT96665.1 hypothetical protein [Ferruginibacter sp.]HRD42736.1 hypothetical protein [Ferruginibacter sp.]
MKTIFSLFTILSISFCAIAQLNNPYYGFADQYFQGINTIVSDIQKNGFKGVDEASLNYYQKKIPFQTSMNTELAYTIYNIKKQKEIKIDDIINSNTKMSAEAKSLTIKILSYPKNATTEERENYYSNIAVEVLNSRVTDPEREILLRLTDIGFSTARQGINGDEGRGNCDIFGPNGSGPTSAAVCVIGSAAIGFWTGFEACGVWCGIGGAVVFGVLAAITVC